MTREEAIGKWINPAITTMWNEKKCQEIIKALEQDQCEDCISRQAALDLVDSYSGSQSNVEDVTQDMISDILALPPVNPQEPFKPMVEIDLDYVIKQKYIEREVLDKIRAEIEEQVLESLSDGGDDWFTAEKVNECLEIIDKYRAEREKV